MPLLLVTSAMETLRSPIATFVLLLAIALIIPPIFERLKLPGLVGLIAAGIVFGSSALGWLDPASETMKLLSEIGKIYLMFVAGLEIDLALFQKTRNRSLTFGTLTFIIPFVSGLVLGLGFGFGWLAAVLIGSLLASHTLLAYPIIQRLGVVSDEAVTITVGATIVTDITALIVLAVCLGISKDNFTAVKLVGLLGSLGLYTVAVLWGLKRLAVSFFRSTGKDEGNQFLFVMLSVFLAAVVAQMIGVEGIIGAFLAGLAINSVIGDGAVKEKTEFLGSVLFIPMFFINMGLLLDLAALRSLFEFIQLPLFIVLTLLGSKLLASLITKWCFGYSWIQTWTMWSLSIPQVAATLAAALVGYQANIINAQVFNSVILLMLVTAILGPLVTAQTARRLSIQATSEDVAPLSWLPVPDGGAKSVESVNFDDRDIYAVIVPVYNPRTELRLLELAAIIAQYERGKVVALAVAIAQKQMDSPQLTRAIAHSRRRLEAAKAIHELWSVPLETALRLDYGVSQAICLFSREQSANLIVLGMGRPPKFKASLLNAPVISTPLLQMSSIGRVHDAVLWSAHCPVVVARLLESPTQFKNILLPIETPSPMTIRVLRLAQVIAAANQGKVTLLYVCSPFVSSSYQQSMRSQLHRLIQQLPVAQCQIEVVLKVRDNRIAGIVQFSQGYDVVVLRSQRHRVGSGLSLSTTTAPLLNQLNQSVILVGEPTIANAV
ncbi:cation:proton antiporter [cf. Phormidesmis sp. LEGE 11477]|nr:cation:proton antiporter [cf. Phormidesmis sp. LEGE 11477]